MFLQDDIHPRSLLQLSCDLNPYLLQLFFYLVHLGIGFIAFRISAPTGFQDHGLACIFRTSAD